MRDLVYHVASTLDGFIAKIDGSVDGFVQEGDHIPEYIESLQHYDTVIMGRNTYEFAYQYGLKPGQVPPLYAHMRNYVISKQTIHSDEGLKIIKESPIDFVKKLKKERGTDIYLCGGGILAGSLLDHGLIDKVALKLNPVLFGNGIPLFGESKKEVALKLIDSKNYDSGVSLLTFEVTN